MTLLVLSDLPIDMNTYWNRLNVLRSSAFDSVWITEEQMQSEEGQICFPPFFSLAGIASATGLGIGTCIAVLPFYQPVHLAESVAMLDIMSKGKMILGAGLGWKGYERYGVSMKERVSRFEETILLLRRLWSETNVTHHGKRFNLSNVTLSIRPMQSHVPIWIGTGSDSENALRRAARLGDAWFTDETTTIPLLRERMKIYRSALKEAGKNLSGLEVPISRYGYVAKDDDIARREIKPHLFHRIKGKIRRGSEAYRTMYRNDDEIDATIERNLEEAYIVGGPDRCIKLIEDYRKEFGMTYMIIRFPIFPYEHEKSLKAIRMFGETVIPHFKAT
jgi:alkanesulfonate monooxygenase SsuD/methylene tetrahydromethanopterin reductase-like flavin-dependent oxidoreductase (luciferase family)